MSIRKMRTPSELAADRGSRAVLGDNSMTSSIANSEHLHQYLFPEILAEAPAVSDSGEIHRRKSEQNASEWTIGEMT